MVSLETKKISWKWRLKGGTVVIPTGGGKTETKKISWKWRLKVTYLLSTIFSPSSRETKKISWKWRLKERCTRVSSVWLVLRNKENLLKMEIESLCGWSPLLGDHPRNKENLLKMEIERIYSCTSTVIIIKKQRKSPENGDWKIVPFNTDLNPVTPHQFITSLSEKQRKSPENGDWKDILLHLHSHYY